MKRYRISTAARVLGVVLLGSAMTLTGCAAENPTPVDPENGSNSVSTLPEEIQDRGVLRIGVSPNFPPMNFQDDSGNLTGFEIEVGRAVGEALGIEIEHVTTNFAGLLTGLEADRFDVVLSGVNDTKEREQQVDFVNYIFVGANLLISAENPHGIDTYSDLCGLIVAETIGTGYADQIKELSDEHCDGKEPIEVQSFPSGVEVTQAIATGRADASLATSVANLYFAAQSNGELAVVDEVINPFRGGFLVPKGNDDLVESLRVALQELMDNGELDAIMTEWGVQSALLDEVVVNGAES